MKKELKQVSPVLSPTSKLELSEIYKIMTGKSAVDPGVWFEEVNRGGVVTRQVADTLNVKIPAARLNLRKNFFSVRVCEILEWNNLPSDIKSSVNVKSFKTNYRRYTGSNPSQAADEPGIDVRD
jgi:hypothetical protein